MFIQIIQGKCTRQDELRAMAERWRRRARPRRRRLARRHLRLHRRRHVPRRGPLRVARGRDGATPQRPEQGAWAEQMMALMDGPVEFHDCDDVTLMMDGGSDQAGFVQVIRGKVDDPDRLKAMLADTSCCTRCARTSSAPRWRSSRTARSPRRSPSPTRRAPARASRCEPPAEVTAELELRHAGTRRSTTCTTPGSRRTVDHKRGAEHASARPRPEGGGRADRAWRWARGQAGKDSPFSASSRRYAVGAEPVAVLLGELVGPRHERREPDLAVARPSAGPRSRS